MDAFNTSATPTLEIRCISHRQFVIDVRWPFGTSEQLIGVYSSWQHASDWLLNDASMTLGPMSPLDIEYGLAVDNDNSTSR